jgi:hypothetical protein
MGHTFMIRSVNIGPSDVMYTLKAADSRRDGKVRYFRIGMCSYCEITFY